MSCIHENKTIIDSSITEVSVFGAELLLEKMVCNDCGKILVQPYLSLGLLSADDDMLIVNDKELLPSLEYIEKVLVIKRQNIPVELIKEISIVTHESRSTGGQSDAVDHQHVESKSVHLDPATQPLGEEDHQINAKEPDKARPSFGQSSDYTEKR